jgi:CBS-domain-containing membrane protein
MVVGFLLPQPRPPDNSGDAPLPSIQEDQVYIDTPLNRIALQQLALERKIFHNGCDTKVAQGGKISIHGLTTTIKRSKVTTASQDLCSVVSLMQRMASDRTEDLEQFLKNQEKQARREQRASRKTEQILSKMMSMMSDFSKLQSTSRHKNKKVSAKKPSKGTMATNSQLFSPLITRM